MTGRAGNTERLALAALTWAAEPGDPRLAALARVHGPVTALQLITSGRLPAPSELDTGSGQKANGRRHSGYRPVPNPGQVATVFHSGLRLICPGDDEWPTGLDALGEAAPIALWARGSGHLAGSCARSVAVTGTRASSPFGNQAARALAAQVSAQGWTVISGGLRGIDAAAHRGALGAGRASVAVLGGGLDTAIPRGRGWLARAVSERGVLVSEHPPGRRMTRARILARNRVIAALALGTVIVEAAPLSSALEAARYAHSLRRPVMAVPWSVPGIRASGCETLVRGGHAIPVTSGAQAIEVITAADATGRDSN